MTPQQLETIFENPNSKLMRGDSASMNPYSNKIGLSICKAICKGLNGSISVKSELHIGSKFTFTQKVFTIGPIDNKLFAVDAPQAIEEGKEEDNTSLHSSNNQQSSRSAEQVKNALHDLADDMKGRATEDEIELEIDEEDRQADLAAYNFGNGLA
jgi:hypothetical protein